MKKSGRPKKDEDSKTKRLTVTIESQNFLWCDSFKNRSSIINRALQQFREKNPNYLADYLLGKVD